MKTLKNVSASCAIILLLVFSASLAQAQSLTNELTGQPLSASTTKCVILIHGWNPDNNPNCYSGLEWSSLLTNLKARLNGSGWGVVAYHWEQDANTGSILNNLLINDFFDWGTATAAAGNASVQGSHLADLLTQFPNLREVHFIAHSAGSWAARQAAQLLLIRNPYVIVQITLLDPFIPYPNGSSGSVLSDDAMNGMQFFTGSDRIQRLENYFANDSLSDGGNAYPWGSYTGPTYFTQETFTWRGGIDINQRLDWGAVLVNPPGFNSVTYFANYDWHAGPIQFYSDCISANLFPISIPSGLQGAGCPFDYQQIGWKRSLYAWESLLPQIAVQPANKSAPAGGSVTFSVTANQATDIAWYKVGGNWVGAGSTFTLNNVSSSDAGSYVARLGNSNGQLYSQSASLTVGVATAPTTTSVSPTSLPTSSSPQLITVYGTNFKPAGDPNASTLIFHDPANNPYVRTPIYVSANQFQYNITVQSATGTWSVIVTNAGLAASNPQTFTVYTAPANTGSLVVNLLPPGATTAGAQWLLNSSYHNSGDVVASLTPGQYTVSFKAVSGYTAPASFPVNIVANQQTTTNATYSAVAATTYTLTLNAASGQGSITPSPIGSGGGNTFTYTAGSLVQLTATAASGYHFTSWSGDASGTVNPTTVTLNVNKNVTANFATGDPNLGTISVTIQPAAAITAGAQWKFNSSGWTSSGGSYNTPLLGANQNYLQFSAVAGWITPSPFYVTVGGGQTTNVTVTYQQDMTPGLLTVTLSPPDAVTAGAHWHVNGGTYGNGASATLTPGNYTVTFDTVLGWTAPTSQSVIMQPSQSKVLPGNYTPPTGQPVIYSVSPPIGQLAGGDLMTINGVNFTAPATVLINGQPAINVSVSSATQITCSTPSSSTNGTVPIVVQTAGGSTTNQNGFAYGISFGKKLNLLCSVGGSFFGAAVQGSYSYVGEGRNFLVLDVSSPSNPSRIGKVTLPGVVTGVALFGQYAYVSDGEGGVQVVDVTSPSLPVIRGFYCPTNSTWSGNIKIYGGRAFVVDEINGFEILDLGNPTMPTLLSSTNFGGWAAEDVIIKASAQGVFAYLTTGDNLQIIDVSQPATPVLLGQVAFTGSGGVYSITMSGNYVFGSSIYDGGKMHMVDVSNPNAPVDSNPSLGGYGMGGYCAVASANNYLYAQSMYDGFGFSVFSISGSTVTQVGRYAPYSISAVYTKIIISGTRAYVAGGQPGLVIMDISSPYSPSRLSSFTDPGLAGGYKSVAVTGNALCASDGVNFKVFNVSQPGQPALVANLGGTGAGNQVLAHNGIAYLSGNGTQVYDVTTPSSPHLLATISNNVANNYRMTFVDNRLYIIGSIGSKPSFVTVDVSTPAFPTVLGTKVITTSPDNTLGYSLAVRGNKALIGITGAEVRLTVFDISNINAPIEQGSLTNVLPYDMRMSSGGNYAYFLDNNSPSILHVLDFSNPNNPIVTNNIPLDISTAMSVEVLGTELYVATLRGLYVFDTSNPKAPVLSRSYRINFLNNHNPIGVTSDSVIQNGIIYLADGDGGVAVLNEQDIQPPNIYITTPVFAPVFTNNTSTIGLGGGSDDNVGVTAIAWANDRGGSGQVSPPLDSWYVSGIKLYPGSNIITATAFDALGNSGVDFLTVIYPTTNKNQTITFPALAAHTFGDSAITLNAAASSGLPVTFSVASGPATLTSSNVLTLNGAGTVTVQASQPGNSSYNPAPSTNVSFTVFRANQSIAFAPVPNHSAGDAPFALAATTSSGLPVYFNILSGPAINSNNIVSLLGGGAVTAIAWQPGNSNYNAAATVQQSFTVSKIPQTITFGALSPQKQGDAPFSLNATSDSGLSVNFSVSGPATLSGNIVTLTGHGTVTVTASQPGNNSYAAATPVVQSFSVAPPDNTLIVLGFQNRSFQMAFYGMAGSNYTVQASSNLLNWQPFTNFIITNSPYSFIDPATTNFNRRFYRAMP